MPDTAPDNRKAAALGAFLRETRESRERSLDDAVQVTRIGKNYLLALEEGVFDKLPSPAYVRGFLRLYAKYLETSADELVARYDECLAGPTVKPAEHTASGRPEPVAERQEETRGRWLVPAALLIVTLIIAAIMNGRDRSEPVKEQALAPQSAGSPAPVQPVRSSASTRPTTPVASPDAQSSEQTAQPVPPATEPAGAGIILRLKVNQDSWLNITIDDAVSQTYDLKAGDLIEWKAEKSFTLDTNNAGGIEAEFNGKPLRPFGEPGKSAHIVLNAPGT